MQRSTYMDDALVRSIFDEIETERCCVQVRTHDVAGNEVWFVVDGATGRVEPVKGPERGIPTWPREAAN